MQPFRKVTELPASLKPGAIEAAVAAFVKDSRADNVPLDADGLYNQLITNIACITIMKNYPTGQFWLAEDHHGNVIAWAMGNVSKDVDNQLCMWWTNAWVAPSYRRTPIVKEWFQQLRAEAKRLMCKHILIPSSRGVEAYCRFLGKQWHPYVTILKEDI